MDIPRRFKQGFIFFTFFGILMVPLANLYAMDPSLPRILDQSTALVSVQSFKPAGTANQEIGRLLMARHAKIAGYRQEGGGVIIDPRGIIVTNHHIVSDASRISVTLFDGTRIPAKLVSCLPGSDIAFLSITPPFGLRHVPLANSDTVLVGSKVYVIGHALGHHGSVYGGKISGILKEPFFRSPRLSFLKVNFGFHMFHGDSGSPLLDRKGYLVGLISAGRRDGDKATFAVASNMIRDAYRQIPSGL